MKKAVLTRNEITPATVKVLARLVAMIPWPDRRQAMGEITLSLLGTGILLSPWIRAYFIDLEWPDNSISTGTRRNKWAFFQGTHDWLCAWSDRPCR